MENIIKSISAIMLVVTMMTTNIFSEENHILAGKDRFETAISISKSWKTSQEAILVNSTATSDLLCATVLSSQIDCPILLTNKNKINESTINEIKRLNANKLYLIGGEDVITENIEKELNKDNINTERIHGEDRYKTSIKVADKINELKKSKTVILVNGQHSVADAVSISPVAGNKNIPVIICKNDNVETQREWIENNNIKKSYIIGGEDVISKEIEKELNKDNIDTERIAGNDRFETNAKVIKNFYKQSKLNKLFYCKGRNIDKEDEIIDGMLVASLAAKEKAPIILLGQNISTAQKNVLNKKNIKSLIQVGYGVSEEAKKELYKIKENYTPPSFDNSPTLKPDRPQIELPIEEEKPSVPNIPPQEDIEDSNIQETLPPGDIEESDSTQGTTPSDKDNSNSSEDTGQGDQTSSTENVVLKDINYTISEDKKNIRINFNKELYSSKENIEKIKKNIKIIIDKNNIKNNQENEPKSIENNQTNKDKYIKLNKYDKVSIYEKSLIIELVYGFIGNSSSIVINENTIKDKEGNYAEKVSIDDIQGINKNIAFVNNENEFSKYIDCEDVDIIKLENNISSDMLNNPIRIKNNVTIDGSNGASNFRITNNADSLKKIALSGDNIKLKNIDLEGIYIEMQSNKNIYLKNMKIDLQDKNVFSSTTITPCIYMECSDVEAKDLILKNNGWGIELKVSIFDEASILTIDGYVYNEKVGEDGNYKPSIKIENKNVNINTDKLNKVILKNQNNHIENMYKIYTKDKNEDGTPSDQNYEYYYKYKEVESI